MHSNQHFHQEAGERLFVRAGTHGPQDPAGVRLEIGLGESEYAAHQLVLHLRDLADLWHLAERITIEAGRIERERAAVRDPFLPDPFAPEEVPLKVVHAEGSPIIVDATP